MGISLHGKTIFPVYHPSYILRQREEYKGWEAQLTVFAGLVHGLVSPDGTWPKERTCLYCARMVLGSDYVCESKSSNHRLWYRRDDRWELKASQRTAQNKMAQGEMF